MSAGEVGSSHLTYDQRPVFTLAVWLELREVVLPAFFPQGMLTRAPILGRRGGLSPDKASSTVRRISRRHF